MDKGKEITARKFIGLQITEAVNNYTIASVARAAKISRTQLHDIMFGRTNYSIDSLTRVVDVLGIELHIKIT